MSLMGSWTCVCLAPKLKQGEDWLNMAQTIAHSLAGTYKAELDRIFAAFCDHCGIGPPTEDDGMDRQHVRALRTWTCDRCDHVNIRPQFQTEGA